MHVLMVFDRNGQEEPGWRWKRADPNSHGFESSMQLIHFSRMSVLMSKGMSPPFSLSWKRYVSLLMKGRGTYRK